MVSEKKISKWLDNLATEMTRHTKSASCGHLVVLKGYTGFTIWLFSFIYKNKTKQKTFSGFPYEDSLQFFIQACVARVCMKFTLVVPIC